MRIIKRGTKVNAFLAALIIGCVIGTFGYFLNNKYETIFLSFDKDFEVQMNEFVLMSGYTVATNTKTHLRLKSEFQIQAVPTLIIVSPEGEIITRNGRGEIADSGNEVILQWIDKYSPMLH